MLRIRDYVLKYVAFVVSFCFYWSLFWAAGVGATSAGPRDALFGRGGQQSVTVDDVGEHLHGRRNHRDTSSVLTSLAPLPNPDFFLDGLEKEIEKDGSLNRTQLQIFLEKVNAQCYTADELLQIHSLTDDQLQNDTRAVLAAVCPTVLYQTASADCRASSGEGEGSHQPPTRAQVWGYGFLFVTIINMSALMGVCVIPCMNKKLYRLVLTYLVGLAVGTLSGNAILSLIPETHGMFASTHGLDFVWRNTTILGGIYLFFVVERILKLVSSRKERGKRKKTASQDDVIHVTAMHDMTEHHDIYKITSCESAIGNGVIPTENGLGPTGNGLGPTGNGLGPTENGLMTERHEEDTINGVPPHQNGQTHAHAHMAVTENGKIQIAAVAYMIIFGDGLHNFVDGLAIGASFAISVFQGISTSIAVMCEEFPHELGDFAILLRSGMTVKQALTFNLLSAFTCYAGLVVGILVGQLTSLEPYIFALAGGMFLYISLVDMLPELNSMNENEEFNLKQALKVFVIQNAGLLTGYTIMILLAVYGEHIAF